MQVANITHAKITPMERIEKPLVDPVALREAVINAVVHNDYTKEVPPLFEIFSDRMEITNYGGLVEGWVEGWVNRGETLLIRDKEFLN